MIRSHICQLYEKFIAISIYPLKRFSLSLPRAIRGILIFRLWRHLWITQASSLSLLWKISSNPWQHQVKSVFPNKYLNNASKYAVLSSGCFVNSGIIFKEYFFERSEQFRFTCLFRYVHHANLYLLCEVIVTVLLNSFSFVFFFLYIVWQLAWLWY